MSTPVWYAGTITGTMMHRNGWIVHYDHEQQPTYEVCRHCVLPWEPLVGDVDVARADGNITAGTVVAHHVEKRMVDVRLADTMAVEQIESWSVRRVQRSLQLDFDAIDHRKYADMQYANGQPVWSRWYDDDGKLDNVGWFAGTVVAYEQENDTYIIVYTDNDEIPGVPPEYLRPLTYKVG